MPNVSPITYSWALEGVRFLFMTAILFIAAIPSVREVLDKGDKQIAPTSGAIFSIGKENQKFVIADGILLALAGIFFTIALAWTGKATEITGLTSPLTLTLVALMGWFLGSFSPNIKNMSGILFAIMAVVLLSADSEVDKESVGSMANI